MEYIIMNKQEIMNKVEGLLNEDYEAQYEYYTENEDYQEEKIREQGYEKPGEQTVVVLPASNSEEDEIIDDYSFWQNILNKVIFWK